MFGIYSWCGSPEVVKHFSSFFPFSYGEEFCVEITQASFSSFILLFFDLRLSCALQPIIVRPFSSRLEHPSFPPGGRGSASPPLSLPPTKSCGLVLTWQASVTPATFAPLQRHQVAPTLASWPFIPFLSRRGFVHFQPLFFGLFFSPAADTPHSFLLRS